MTDTRAASCTASTEMHCQDVDPGVLTAISILEMKVKRSHTPAYTGAHCPARQPHYPGWSPAKRPPRIKVLAWKPRDAGHLTLVRAPEVVIGEVQEEGGIREDLGTSWLFRPRPVL